MLETLQSYVFPILWKVFTSVLSPGREVAVKSPVKLPGLWEGSIHISLERLPIASLTSLLSHLKDELSFFSLSANPLLFLSLYFIPSWNTLLEGFPFDELKSLFPSFIPKSLPCQTVTRCPLWSLPCPFFGCIREMMVSWVSRNKENLVVTISLFQAAPLHRKDCVEGGRWRRDWGKRSNWDWVVPTKEGLGM